jgi:hypothetical protein
MLKILLASFIFWLPDYAFAQSNAPVGPSVNAPTPNSAIPNFTANAGLPHWKTCRNQVKAGTGSGCNIVVMGTSLSTGHGAFFNTTGSDARSGGWPVQLATIGNFYGINFNIATVTGDNSIAAYAAYDTRVTLNGWTEVSTLFTLGGGIFSNNDTTALSFNPTPSTTYPNAPTVNTNALDIYFIGAAPPTASITIDIGGSVICTYPVQRSGFTFEKHTCAVPLGANTYNIKCSLATATECLPVMLNAYNSTVPVVTIFNAAADGSTMENFATNTSNPFDPVATLSAVQPALCIIDSVVNDAAAQTALATYTASLTYIIQGCQAQGADVLVMTEKPGGANTSPITIDQYRAAAVATANSLNVAVWDSMKTYGGANVAAWQAVQPTGWNAVNGGGAADAAHYSGFSQAWDAGVVMNILLQ